MLKDLPKCCSFHEFPIAIATHYALTPLCALATSMHACVQKMLEDIYNTVIAIRAAPIICL